MPEKQPKQPLPPRPFLNPYLAGFLLGLVLFLAFYLTGNGLGASGALNRVTVALEDAFAPGHVDRVAYLAALAGGERPALDNWMVPMLVGTLLGGVLSGLYGRRMKVETHKGYGLSDRQRWLMALLGGAIMGYGARLARGCTSGHALSGGAILSAGSWGFMFSIFGGAYALAWFVRGLWREGPR
jgi:hypothetical protein